jgi:hypothetical protein
MAQSAIRVYLKVFIPPSTHNPPLVFNLVTGSPQTHGGVNPIAYQGCDELQVFVLYGAFRMIKK